MAEDNRLDRIEKILDIVAKEHELFMEEMRQLRKAQAKTDEQMKQIGKEIDKLREAQAKTDEQMKQISKEIDKLREAQAKTDEQMKQTDKKIDKNSRETNKKIDKISRDIGGGLGRAAEGLAAPNVPKVFKRLGFEVLGINQRIKALDKDTNEVISEVDIICPARLNGKKVFLIGEVKAHLTTDDINYFIDEVLVGLRQNYADIFEDLKKKETGVYAFVAGLYVDNAVVRYAQRRGLYILLPSGDTMRLAEMASFKPKVW